MAAAREGRAVIPVMMHLLLGRLWQDFIARLAALVPKPRAHQIRYHGVFAPASPDRARVVPRTRAAVAGECGEASVTDRQRALALTWAQRLKRVFAIEIETCRRCGGRLRVIASIEAPTTAGTQSRSIRRIRAVRRPRASCRSDRSALLAPAPETGGSWLAAGCASISRWNAKIRPTHQDRKSTRLNSSHVRISYAVFCLKKKYAVQSLTIQT